MTRRTLLCILLSIILVISVYTWYFHIRTDAINHINISQVRDGTYTGVYNHGHFDYTVQSTISGRRITEIVIVKNDFTKYAVEAEAVIGRVLNSQSLDVDAVTGATRSSTILLKAIENSLRNGFSPYR